MSTEYVYISGKLSWVHTNKLDKYGKWKATVHPDKASEEIVFRLQKEGCKNKVGKDDDGYYVTYSRQPNITVRGQVIGLAAPEVLNPDGTPLTQALIGNGSDGTLKLEVYPYHVHSDPPGVKKGKAARLLSIRVDNLVPFELKRDFTPEQKELVEGLAEQPKPSF